MKTLETVLDPLFAAMAGLPAFASLAIVSMVVTVVLLAAFKWTSNQAALTRARRGVAAALLELRLFQDDPVLVAGALGRLLVQQARYLRYASVPLLWLALPLLVLAAHLDAWYARTPLAPGAASVVIAKIDLVASAARPALALQTPQGVHVETPVVWSPASFEAAWRIRADHAGEYVLRVRSDEHELTRVLHVGDRLARLEEQWTDVVSTTDQPGNTRVALFNFDYPPRTFELAGLSLSWLPLFFGLTLLLALVLRPLFRVAL